MLCSVCGEAAIAVGLCQRHYSQQGRGTLAPDGPAVGSPSGFGCYGVIDRDEDTILCHECGRRLAALGYHISRAHGMTVTQYRTKHGLKRGVGLVAEGVARDRSQQAVSRVGSPAWQRLEAARDPAAAAHSRVTHQRPRGQRDLCLVVELWIWPTAWGARPASTAS